MILAILAVQNLSSMLQISGQTIQTKVFTELYYITGMHGSQRWKLQKVSNREKHYTVQMGMSGHGQFRNQMDTM